MPDLPVVSLIIPAFNEEKYIGTVLGQLLAQDYPPGKMEILVMDGGSSDRTREIVNGFAEKNPGIRLLINERQYVPFALNLGIREAIGDPVLIIGSHSEYPPDYITRLVSASGELKADNVGGLCVARPPDDTVKSLAIAKAISCPFGVGNAHFRIGSKTIKKVDTVTFGCYRRSVFDKIGFFDEELIRNQDDEFNARLAKSGGSIYLIPDVSVTYFTRDKVKSIVRMFYQYGLFKPLVSYKIGKPTTMRQMVPPAFTLFLILCPLGIWIHPYFAYLLAAGLGSYILADLGYTLSLSYAASQGRLVFYLPWLFFLLHISYGWGYLKGMFAFLVLRKRKKEILSSR